MRGSPVAAHLALHAVLFVGSGGRHVIGRNGNGIAVAGVIGSAAGHGADVRALEATAVVIARGRGRNVCSGLPE